jgi:hypothetical protein
MYGYMCSVGVYTRPDWEHAQLDPDIYTHSPYPQTPSNVRMYWFVSSVRMLLYVIRCPGIQIIVVRARTAREMQQFSVPSLGVLQSFIPCVLLIEMLRSRTVSRSGCLQVRLCVNPITVGRFLQIGWEVRPLPKYPLNMTLTILRLTISCKYLLRVVLVLSTGYYLLPITTCYHAFSIIPYYLRDPRSGL